MKWYRIDLNDSFVYLYPNTKKWEIQLLCWFDSDIAELCIVHKIADPYQSFDAIQELEKIINKKKREIFEEYRIEAKPVNFAQTLKNYLS